MSQQALSAEERDRLREHCRDEARDRRIRNLIAESEDRPHRELGKQLDRIARLLGRYALAVAEIDTFNGEDLARMELAKNVVHQAAEYFWSRS